MEKNISAFEVINQEEVLSEHVSGKWDYALKG